MILNNIFLKLKPIKAVDFYDNQYEKTNNSVLLRLKADFLYRRNPYQAVAAYDEYLAIEPSDVEAIGLRINLKKDAGEAVNIEKKNDRILSIDANNVIALKNKFLIFCHQHKQEEAREIGAKLYSLQPDDLEFMVLLIQLYGEMYDDEQFDNAIEEMKRNNPDDSYNIEYRKGLYFKGERFYDKAIEVFNNLNKEYDFA